MAEGGWVGIAIPEEWGGGGRGITEAASVLEEVAASGAAMNGCSALHLSIFGMNPVVKHGTEAMRAEYLPLGSRPASCTSRSGSPSPTPAPTRPRSPRGRRLDGDHYIVRGRKVWTTKALYCQKVLLLVRTTPLEECKRRTDGMTLLLADLQRPEVDIRPIPKVGRNAVVSCEVRYDDLPVAVTDRVGEEGEGFRYLLDGLNPERILVAAEAVGIGRAAIRGPSRTPTSASSSTGRSARTRASRSRWPRPTPGCTRRARGVRGGRSATTPGCRAVSRRTWPSGWPPTPAIQAADQAMQTHGGFGYAEGIRRRALLARGSAHAHRSDLAGAGARLRRRARARAAAVVLMGSY